MSKILAVLSLSLLMCQHSHAQDNFRFISKPEYYDSEGMRGYAADISVSGKKMYITDVCEFYSPAYAGHEVTWYDTNDMPNNYSFKDVKGRFIDREYSYNRVPFEFYKMTCGKDKRFSKYFVNSVR